MMDFIRNWVVSATAAGLVFALLQGLLPEGSGKRIVRLAGGIVLALVIFSPLAQIDPERLSLDMDSYARQQEGSVADIQQASEKITKEIIREETGAYIVNKAQALGLSVRVEVGLAEDKNGLTLPDTVIIRSRGALSEADRARLSDWMADVLGIAPRKQDWRWEE